MKKYATIDIGTNSMRLLLAEMEGNKIINGKKEINTTRIGASVDAEGYITKEGLQRNLEAYISYVHKAKSWGAEKIWAIATSAVRDAGNSQEFIQKALEATYVPIEIISGEEEAKLGFYGVMMGMEEEVTNTIVIDVGGGSTEFILGNKKEIQEKLSLNIGAVRLTERCITSDPINEEDYKALTQSVVEELNKNPLFKKDLHGITAIGIGGTATTLGAVHQKLASYDKDKIHKYRLRLTEVEDILKIFRQAPLQKRKNIIGLDPKRADIIISGTVILLEALKYLKLEELVLSDYDNLEGLLFSKLEGN